MKEQGNCTRRAEKAPENNVKDDQIQNNVKDVQIQNNVKDGQREAKVQKHLMGEKRAVKKQKVPKDQGRRERTEDWLRQEDREPTDGAHVKSCVSGGQQGQQQHLRRTR